MTEHGKRLERAVHLARRVERLQADLRDLAATIREEVALSRAAVLREEASEQQQRAPMAVAR